NYYFSKSRISDIAIEPTQKGEESVALRDTATGEPIAFMNASPSYDMADLQKGLDQIDKGIQLHPTRLDMRFGKVYVLGETGNYDAMTNEIVAAIEYGKTINRAWLWQDGKKLDDP